MIECPKCHTCDFETIEHVRVILRINQDQCVWAEAHHFDSKPKCECQNCGHVMEIDLSKLEQ